MRYFLAFFLLTLAIGIAFAGQGCGPFSGDGVCDHFCKNCVLTKSSDPCPEGCDNDCQVATSKPVCGSCGGAFWATCQCGLDLNNC
ncbi:hypothetical protein F8M41_006702 [Gigaspora margarita]|uniref:Uncharacterized protein n=1 Tax=Gigaspora margarita TaxID=4874 RepID=A0A8H4A5W6_GIGMA|nr:hypothetical protein F8M41_006702 [Gigaspora margarita]